MRQTQGFSAGILYVSNHSLLHQIQMSRTPMAPGYLVLARTLYRIIPPQALPRLALLV